MRRVVIAVVTLLVVLVVGFAVVPHLQARTLSENLIRDVAALRATAWSRTPAPSNPQHDNGYQCVASVLKVTPRDLTPFKLSGPPADGGVDLQDWLKTEDPEPLDTLPPELDVRMQALVGWADGLRGCGDSSRLKLVDGFEPWDLPPRYGEAMMALTRYTWLETRRLLTTGQVELAFNRCNAALALAVDQSHQGLLGAMVAISSLQRLAPVCVEAFNGLPPELRAITSAQWVTLATRFESSKEVFEIERLSSSMWVFAPLSSDPDVPRSKEAPPVEQTPWGRYRYLRMWNEWDLRMRELAEVADVPEKRRPVAERLDAISAWLGSPDYERFAQRLDLGRTLLSTLQWIGAGAKGEPPPGVTRVEGGVEWTDSDGKPRRIPVAP